MSYLEQLISWQLPLHFRLHSCLITTEKDGFFFFERRDLTLIFLAILPLWLITLYFINATEIPRTKRYRTILFEYIQSSVAVSLYCFFSILFLNWATFPDCSLSSLLFLDSFFCFLPGQWSTRYLKFTGPGDSIMLI